MSPIISRISDVDLGALVPVFGLLLDTALKGSLLIAAAAIAAHLLRKRSAAARHAAWSAAVIGHLALPILTLLVPQWRLPLLPAPPWLESSTAVSAPAITPPVNAPELKGAPTGSGPVTTTETPVAGESAPATSGPTLPAVTGGTSPTPTDRSPSLLHILGLLWILGVTVVLLRLAIGTWRVGKLAKEGDRVDDGEWLSLTLRVAKRLGITRPLTLLRGDSLAVPVTWGVVYPAVLLPPDSHEWPEARRRFVLVHEMAHVKRFDALTQLVAQITISILWFDPLLWLAAHRMRVEREHACDDYVIRDGTLPSLYAGELLEMVQSIGSPRHEKAAPAFAALAMARRSEFEGRMLAILDPRQERHTLGRRSALLASAALALMVLPLAALRPFDTQGPKAPAASTAQGNPARATRVATVSSVRKYSDTMCDSLRALPGDRSTNLLHIDSRDDGAKNAIEYLTIDQTRRCTMAVVVGQATFADDRLLTIPAGGYGFFREIMDASDRVVRVTPAASGVLEYRAERNGRAAAFDDEMRTWVHGFVPTMLIEAAVDAPQRVARKLDRGGLDGALQFIGSIRSPASRRAHYEALLDGDRLTEAQYERITHHAVRSLANSPDDLAAVMTRIAAPPEGTKSLGAAVYKLGQAQRAMGRALDTALGSDRSSTDSANTLKQYGATNDPEMMLMALRGAKEISSDTDKRTLLQTMISRALGPRRADLRKAFFDVVETIESDTDGSIVLSDALA